MKIKLLYVLLIAALLLAACGPTTAATPAVPDNTGGDTGTDVEPAEVTYRISLILPGQIHDADYSQIGYEGTQFAAQANGIEFVYSENVAVPNAAAEMQKHIDGGSNIIFVHGSQFNEAALSVARENLNVAFIIETDTSNDALPANVWNIVRHLETGAYMAGRAAAEMTQTGHVGYMAGLPLLFTYAEVHAIEQAFRDAGADIELHPVWTGDFNDVPLAGQTSAQLIADHNVDVIISSLNAGTSGVFSSAVDVTTPVKVIAKYADKIEQNPPEDVYVGAVLYDYTTPLVNIIGQIIAGVTRGNYELSVADGSISFTLPMYGVDDRISNTVSQALNQLSTGVLNVIVDTTPID